ncbi:MAG: GDSL-type esterase/lipase family protein [Limisphaerales bacterium]
MPRSTHHGTRRRPNARRLAVALAVAFLSASGLPSSAASWFRTNDVVAFLGGSSVVAAEQAGFLETTLTLAHPGYRLRFRSLGWEGDSVFERPRELNFPDTPHLLRQCGATVVVLEFGTLEARDPGFKLTAFLDAYRGLIDSLGTDVRRSVVVIPPPLEAKPPPLPDFSRANVVLAELADAVRTLAGERHLPVIDLHESFTRQPPTAPRTHDGLDPTPAGHRAIAAAWAQALGRQALAVQVRDPAFWNRADIAALHEAVRTKNRLWFDAWRPMNWAFLAGDRTEQQASRDHLDRTVRWFPAEMRQFDPLIVEAEIRVESLSAQIQIAP